MEMSAARCLSPAVRTHTFTHGHRAVSTLRNGLPRCPHTYEDETKLSHVSIELPIQRLPYCWSLFDPYTQWMDGQTEGDSSEQKVINLCLDMRRPFREIG